MPTSSMIKTQGPYAIEYRSATVLPWNNGSWSLSSNGSMFSETHYPLNTDIDDGGAWLMSKTEQSCTPGHLNTVKYKGPFTVANPRSGWNPITGTAQPTDLAMIAKGTTAIARCTPNNPAYSIPQLIGEAREGLSPVGFAALKSRVNAARLAGDEYINYEFGWAAMARDLQTFATAVNKSHSIWKAYKKGSGNKTRVGYHFPEVNDSQSYSGLFNPYPTQFTEGFLTGTVVQYLARKDWFKGCFKYYIPEPVGFDGKMAYWHSQASKILGVRLTPDTVWNLNPWTWAADWFANTGDMMTNVSNLGVDGLVLQYGYAMASEEIKTYTVASVQGATTTRSILTKRAKRIPASPYGFGVTLSSLSTKQLAIIAALGLGRT